ncbi:hypothetical protein Pcinc_012003 [Petrolisthes cinctipes]|uniref:Uncharacterized protein n=1 Tax=Petrolisthes cinctipes TaxID=88211 RepID=A0AAE1G5P0_PETCI|nr:hypothetical protein Pcinc_012003 [Petrolisthes cinctipes]
MDLQATSAHQYLGVLLDQRLTFRPHVRYVRDRMQALIKVLQLLSWRGFGASVPVKKHFYTAAIRSVSDYSAPCLPGINHAQVHQLEVAQREALRAILAVPRWIRIKVICEECGLPSIHRRILAQATLAMIKNLRCWPFTPLASQLRHAFQRPLNIRPDGDWVHANANAARTLQIKEDLWLQRDLPANDYQPTPPWEPTSISVNLAPCTRPKAQLPALL